MKTVRRLAVFLTPFVARRCTVRHWRKNRGIHPFLYTNGIRRWRRGACMLAQLILWSLPLSPFNSSRDSPLSLIAMKASLTTHPPLAFMRQLRFLPLGCALSLPAAGSHTRPHPRAYSLAGSSGTLTDNPESSPVTAVVSSCSACRSQDGTDCTCA